MGRKTIIVTALVAATVVGGTAFRLWRGRAYEIVQIKTGDLTEAIYGLGKVKSRNRFEVRLGVTSTVEKVFVREGDFVKNGAKLIEFDSRATFRAPFDGVVTLVGVYEGETSPPGVALVRVEDLKTRIIEVSIEQQGAIRIRPGQPAQVSFESVRGKNLPGKVLTIFPREDEFLVHIDVPDLSDTVLPGMTADVSIEVGKISGARLIPLQAVRDGLVTVDRGGRREKIKIEIGHVDGLWAELKGEALKVGDQIVVMKAKK